MIPQRDRFPAPRFKVWHPDETEPTTQTSDAANQRATRGLNPGITLTDFFHAWFAPIVLAAEVNAAAGTLAIYEDALRWWQQLTGDPPLNQIDEFTAAQFITGLRAATYRRGKFGVPRPLSRASQRKIIKCLRAVLYRTGPTTDPARQAKNLLEQAPRLAQVEVGKPQIRPAFAIADARAIYAACTGTDWHQHAPGHGRRLKHTQAVPAPVLLRAWLGLLYYTGLRTGTTLKLTRDMLTTRRDGHWLVIPEHCVPKTHKARDVFVHPHLFELLESVRRHAATGEHRSTAGNHSTDNRLIPFTGSYDALRTRHERLQIAAGIPVDRRQSPQAWRRTHGTEIFRVGARMGIEAARIALDHADDVTTREFYVQVQPELIGRLPQLKLDSPDGRQQMLFPDIDPPTPKKS